MDATVRHLAVPLDLGGPTNFRDLGGYPTNDGFVVRRGRVFRSDGLWGLTESDLTHLLDEIGLRTIVDLRASVEIERYGSGLLATSGLPIHNVTFFDESLRPDFRAEGSWTLDDLYLFFIKRAGQRVASVLTMLALSELHPVVFHCTAGKDRTGVVAAFLLSLLGVSDDDIADDYAQTCRCMPLFVERARSFLEDLQREAPAFTEHVYIADREIILRLLGVVRDEYDSVEEWALASGMTANSIDSLRAALLERSA